MKSHSAIATVSLGKGALDRLGRIEALTEGALQASILAALGMIMVFLSRPEWLAAVEETPWLRVLLLALGISLIFLSGAFFAEDVLTRLTGDNPCKGLAFGRYLLVFYVVPLPLGFVFVTQGLPQTLSRWASSPLLGDPGAGSRLLLGSAVLGVICLLSLGLYLLLRWQVEVAHAVLALTTMKDRYAPSLLEEVWEELLAACRDPDHKSMGDSGAPAAVALRWRLLVNNRGQMRRSVRHVVALLVQGKDPVRWLRRG